MILKYSLQFEVGVYALVSYGCLSLVFSQSYNNKVLKTNCKVLMPLKEILYRTPLRGIELAPFFQAEILIMSRFVTVEYFAHLKKPDKFSPVSFVILASCTSGKFDQVWVIDFTGVFRVLE